MSGLVRIIPDPVPPQTIKRYVWVHLEDKAPVFSWPYPSEGEARRFHPPKKAALLELVIPRDETLAAIKADTWGDEEAPAPVPPPPAG